MVKLSCYTAILISLIIILRMLTLNRLPKKTFVILWGIVILRLFCPFYLPCPSIAEYLPGNVQEFSVSMMVIDTSIESAISSSDANSLFEKSSVLPHDLAVTSIIIWLVGAAGIFGYIITTHIRCLFIYKESLPVNNHFIDEWTVNNKLKRHLCIAQSDRISTPLTYGIVNPVILLPKTIDMNNLSQLNYILTHELIHIKRFDILKRWILAITLCIYWFNPFVWIMYVLACRDIELHCDESVLKFCEGYSKSSYALAIIELEEIKSRLSPLSNCFANNSARERINAIMKANKGSLWVTISAFIITLCVSSPFFVTYADESHEMLYARTENEDSIIYSFSLDNSRMISISLDTIWEELDSQIAVKLSNAINNKNWTDFSMDNANVIAIEYGFKPSFNKNRTPESTSALVQFLSLIYEDIKNGNIKAYSPSCYRVDSGFPDSLSYFDHISIFDFNDMLLKDDPDQILGSSLSFGYNTIGETFKYEKKES